MRPFPDPHTLKIVILRHCPRHEITRTINEAAHSTSQILLLELWLFLLCISGICNDRDKRDEMSEFALVDDYDDHDDAGSGSKGQQILPTMNEYR